MNFHSKEDLYDFTLLKHFFTQKQKKKKKNLKIKGKIFSSRCFLRHNSLNNLLKQGKVTQLKRKTSLHIISQALSNLALMDC